jgi:hypothetical protein
LLTYLIPSNLRALEKKGQIVWRILDIKVVTGINRIMITVEYESPCMIFRDEFFGNINKRNELNEGVKRNLN